MTVHELSRVDARRVAVRAQLLDSRRPAGLLEVVRHLTLLQIDPTAAIATADRKAGMLRVDAIHQDVPFDSTTSAAVDGEIKDLAHWLELDLRVTT
jgi:uncharacterized protein YcaQ